ncbi:MAG: hypothetical protein JXR59_04185 [Desulfuromonadaceae bacterium]|nr:hypothetical protein [Desulfuromonadaceae bacterium]
MNRLRSAIQASRCGDPRQLDETTLCQDYLLGADFPAFAGHFPGDPIVPAVVQILIAQVTAEAAWPQHPAWRSVERARFQKQLRPDQLLTVCCCRKKVRGRLLIDARLECEGKTAASFWLTLAEPENVQP